MSQMPAIVYNSSVQAITEYSTWIGKFKTKPADIIKVKGERLKLPAEKPDSWKSGMPLNAIRTDSSPDAITAIDSLCPNSVIVRYNGRTLVKNRDYLIDEKWGVLGLGAEPSITSNDVVEVDYSYSHRRIDAVVLDLNGNQYIIHGRSALTTPFTPLVTPGHRLISHLFVDYLKDGKSPEVFEIKAAAKSSESAKCLIPKTVSKLRSGQAVKIVCWGDSVTEGGDASTPDYRYPNILQKMLRSKFPDSQIDVETIAVGGSNSTQWLWPEKFKHHLRPAECDFNRIIKAMPDLVTIEFVNDSDISGADYGFIYNEILDKLAAACIEVIITTPHFTHPSWMRFRSLKSSECRSYVFFLRHFAKERGVALADVSRCWEQLKYQGIPYITLLRNGVNHPDDRGHKIYADEIMECF